MSFSAPKETRQQKRDRRERENKDIQKKKAQTKRKHMDKLKAEKILKEKRSVVISQPKTPKKQKQKPKKETRETLILAKKVAREIRESKKARESMEASGQKMKRMVGERESGILGSGIVHATGNTKKSRTLASKIKAQPEKLCKGVFPLSMGEVSNGSSVSFISRGKVLAVLTYTNRAKFVKINTLCSTGGRGGSKLMTALRSKFPSKQFRLDSVPTAVAFWKKQGFKVIGKSGLLTTMVR